MKKLETFNLVYRIEIITPERAVDYLKHSLRQRQLSQHKIRDYAKIMAAGKWRLNPADAIVFDRDGYLINGQHRLSAIIKYDKPVELVVGRGADPDSFHVMDCGMKRGINDIFHICGIKNSRLISAIINRYFTLKRGRMTAIAGGYNLKLSSNADIPKSDYLDEYYSDEEFWQDLARYSNGCYKSLTCLKSGDIGGIYAYLIKEKRHTEDVVKRFFTELAFGGMEYKAIAQLRMALTNEKGSIKKFTPTYRHALFAKSWNLFLKGKKKTPLEVKEDELGIDFV